MLVVLLHRPSNISSDELSSIAHKQIITSENLNAHYEPAERKVIISDNASGSSGQHLHIEAIVCGEVTSADDSIANILAVLESIALQFIHATDDHSTCTIITTAPNYSKSKTKFFGTLPEPVG